MKHFVIPDNQIKHKKNYNYLHYINKYIINQIQQWIHENGKNIPN